MLTRVRQRQWTTAMLYFLIVQPKQRLVLFTDTYLGESIMSSWEGSDQPISCRSRKVVVVENSCKSQAKRQASGWFARWWLRLRPGWCTTRNQLAGGPGQTSHPVHRPKHPNCGRTGAVVIALIHNGYDSLFSRRWTWPAGGWCLGSG